MRRCTVWFLLFAKRLFQNLPFLLALALPIVFSYCYRQVEKKTDNQALAGIYVQDTAEETQGAVKSLLAKEGAFSYSVYSSREELERAVSTGQIECGYILPEGFWETFEKGIQKNSITVLKSPATLLSHISDEEVFAALFLPFAKEKAAEYAAKQDFLTDGQREKAKEWVLEAYEQAWENDVFSFVYETIDGISILENKNQESLFPIQGIVSIFMLLAGLFGLMRYWRDEKKGIFFALPQSFCYYLLVISVGTPTLLFGVSGFLAMVVGGFQGQGASEIPALLIYSFFVTFFVCLLSGIVHREETLLGLLPVFALGSLLFCPIFFQITGGIPWMQSLGKLFLPWYYLKKDYFCMTVLSLLFFGGSVWLFRRRSRGVS